MKYALLFPGQGAQKVGMGADLVSRFSSAKQVFEEGNQALAYDLSKIIFEGPDSLLTLTENTQPAILLTGIALYRALTVDLGVELKPECVAGHSLGEHTALAAAGCLSVGDLAKLVHVRGKLMQQAVPQGEGKMAAVLGLDDQMVIQVCQQAAQGQVCEAANFNCPKQVVISGETHAVERAIGLAKEAGAKKVLLLNVSAPFHCSLMRPVAEPLCQLMDQFDWQKPSCPLVQNVNAEIADQVQQIKTGLQLQSYSAVLWTDSIRKMESMGVTHFIEFGPGKVLSGMVKKIHSSPVIYNIETADDVEKFSKEVDSWLGRL